MNRSTLCALGLLLGGMLSIAGEVHWSYRPLASGSPPSVSAGNIENAVDQFIVARLKSEGLDLSPEADRRTLIRRLSLDLVGLPPSPDEVDAFVGDRRAGAYERLVDRLLASPPFGERWGRHWLDAAGYVDVMGADNDAVTVKYADGKYHYRDYVIRSLNSDKPFDEFLTQQLAGDELVDWRATTNFTADIREHLIATTFLRAAADDTGENELNTPDIRHRVLHHATEIVSANLLAMTVQCAKCHDHKYDPITQRDFYSLAAILSPAFNPSNWKQPADRRLADIPLPARAKIDKFNEPIDKQIKKLEKRRTAASKNKKKKLVARLNKTITDLRKTRKSYGHYQTIYDVAGAPEMHILKRGDHLTPGVWVTPRLPTIIDPDLSAYVPAVHEVKGRSTGRRLSFARSLTAPGTGSAGLAARVQVNRVWQHLFGRGLVASSANFGPSGQKPSHPELLEWLSHRFVVEGYRLKPLIRLIVTAAVYRQSATTPPNPKDANNRLFSRMPLKRLESEVVRDSLLSVAGSLDTTMGGRPIPTRYYKDGRLEFDSKRMTGTTNGYRRSVYILARRNYHLTLLNLFDQPSLNKFCTERAPSASVTQSLAMLNDQTVIEQSKKLARQIGVATKSPRLRDWIDHAFRSTLGRPPHKSEGVAAQKLLQSHIDRYLATDIPWTEAAEKALEHLAQMLLNTNEFLYSP